MLSRIVAEGITNLSIPMKPRTLEHDRFDLLQDKTEPRQYYLVVPVASDFQNFDQLYRTPGSYDMTSYEDQGIFVIDVTEDNLAAAKAHLNSLGLSIASISESYPYVDFDNSERGSGPLEPEKPMSLGEKLSPPPHFNVYKSPQDSSHLDRFSPEQLNKLKTRRTQEPLSPWRHHDQVLDSSFPTGLELR